MGGFDPMEYKDIRDEIVRQFSVHSPEIEEDGIPGPRRLHSGRPDPRGHPPLPPDKTALQEAWDRLLGFEASRIAREIDKADNKHISGSLEDIREKLMIK